MTLHDSTAIIDSFYISSLLSSSACVSQSSVILIIWQTCIVNSLFSNAGAASTYHYNVPWGWAQWRPTHGKQSSAKSTNYHWWFRLVPRFPIVRRVALRNVITHKPVLKLAYFKSAHQDFSDEVQLVYIEQLELPNLTSRIRLGVTRLAKIDLVTIFDCDYRWYCTIDYSIVNYIEIHHLFYHIQWFFSH